MDLRPADALYRELSSAAVDVEIARISRSWDVDEAETYVLQRKAGVGHTAALAERLEREKPKRGKKSFHALRNGSALKPGHAARLQLLFPQSNVALWFAHPIADVLCHPVLGADVLIGYLRRLPIGAVRNCVWRNASIRTAGIPALGLAPWEHQLRYSLERIGTPISLFALLARLRLEQLLGNFEGGLEATQISYRILPKAMARCRNLLISKDALIAAMDYFLSWQPFADARLYEMLRIEGGIGRQAAVVECRRIWLADSTIPTEMKLLRSGYVTADMVPYIADENSWWNVFFSRASFEAFKGSDWPDA